MPRKTVYNVHITDVQRFKRCRRLWGWSSPLRGNLTTRETYSPFFVGTLVHHGLEQHYRYAMPPAVSIEKLFLDTVGHLPTTVLDPNYADYRLALVLCQHYLLWQKYDQTPLADANFAFVSPEHEFSYKLWGNTRREIRLKGRFDGIVQQLSTGKYYLWEIKTTRSITERQKQLELDSQTDAYLAAADHVLQHELGIKANVAGIIYTLLRKKEPSSPEVLKNGLLSQKKIDTSAPWYLQAVKKHHGEQATKAFVAEHYSEMINTLLTEANPFFARLIVTRTPDELRNATAHLLQVAHEMIDPNVPLYYNPDERCNYCVFRSPCIAVQQGRKLDALHLLQTGYKPNESYLGEQVGE